jgi:type I restriction enzyme M protein
MSMGQVTTLHQVEALLLAAASRFGKIDVATRRNYVFVLLLLKRSWDVFDDARNRVHARELARTGDEEEAREAADDPDEYTDEIFVPKDSVWPGLLARTSMVGNALNQALRGLEEHNADLTGVLTHIDFNRTPGGARPDDRTLIDLIRTFDNFSLRDADVEYPGLIGDAYESLLTVFAGAAGFDSGDMYTPRSIVRLMVRMAEPAPGDTVYDPCVGSGGMLIQARQYVADHFPGRSGHLALAGQEISALQWVSARLNLLFHGIRDADVQLGDTLADPQHLTGGGPRRFSRILCNPEFSVAYDAAAVEAKAYGRFRYGWAKAGDLMFIQHMVTSLADSGVAVSVMPHGVLFRSGREQAIRQGLLRDDVIEAIVGLGPQLFSGTGIPACLVVLRAPGGKPPDRKGRMLIVNADREYRSGRAGNHLGEAHIEKIGQVCREWRQVEGFSRVVSVDDVLADDANLNIRRWVDNTPPPEPQDVSAHLYGGVPAGEVEALRPAFSAFGLDIDDFFVRMDDGYLEFPTEGMAASIQRIETRAAGPASALHDRCDSWWEEQRGLLLEPMPSGPMAVREQLVATFRRTLDAQQVLDEFALTGLVAQWWVDHLEEIQSLRAGGPRRVVESWGETIQSGLRSGMGTRSRNAVTERREAREHPLTAYLLRPALEELAEAENTYLDLDVRVKSAAQEDDGEVSVSSAEVKRLEKERAAARSLFDRKERELPARFTDAVGQVSDWAAGEIVLAIMGVDLTSRFDAQVEDALRGLLDRYRALAEKYEVSLEELEQERDAASRRLTGLLAELGYRRRVRRRTPETPPL